MCSINCANCGTQEGCQNASICTDDSMVRQALSAANPSGNYDSGACTYDATYDLDIAGYLCSGSADVLSPVGCLNVSVQLQSSCLTQWYHYASNATSCLDVSRYGCYDASKSQWVSLNESECLACSSTSRSTSWMTLFSWQSSGTWTSGAMKPLEWVQRQYVVPNVLKSSIDYSLLFSMIKSAVTTQFAYAYYTEAQCRYVLPSQLVQSVVCKCDPTTGLDAQTCFASASNVPMGQGRGCPFLESSITTRFASLIIHSGSFPEVLGSPSLPSSSPSLSSSPPSSSFPSGCKVISFSYTSPSQYRLNTAQTVSQGLFRDSPTNAFWVVVNGVGAHIGQIASGGVTVDIPVYPLGENVSLHRSRL